MFNVHNNSLTLFVYVCNKFLHWPDWCPSFSDSLTNFLTLLFIRIFNISVCQNQIMYARKSIMHVCWKLTALHHNIISCMYVWCSFTTNKVTRTDFFTTWSMSNCHLTYTYFLTFLFVCMHFQYFCVKCIQPTMTTIQTCKSHLKSLLPNFMYAEENWIKFR